MDLVSVPVLEYPQKHRLSCMYVMCTYVFVFFVISMNVFYSLNVVLSCFHFMLFRKSLPILRMKQSISTALMREKPVRSPMVPPMAASWSSTLSARSWQLSNMINSEQSYNIYRFFLCNSRKGRGVEMNPDKLKRVVEFEI